MPLREAGIIPRAAALLTQGEVFGAIAQLGERYNGIVEVDGSIPSGSTNQIEGSVRKGWPLLFVGEAPRASLPR